MKGREKVSRSRSGAWPNSVPAVFGSSRAEDLRTRTRTVSGRDELGDRDRGVVAFGAGAAGRSEWRAARRDRRRRRLRRTASSLERRRRHVQCGHRSRVPARAGARATGRIRLRRGGSLRYNRFEMADPARGRATYDDLLRVPDHLVAEIIGGELVTSPRPAPAHARAASSLGGELYGPFDRGKNGPGGWGILDEPELHLHGDVLVPDLASWRRERTPELPDAAAFELAPDWACEVLSPSTAARDRADKVPIYLRERVSYVWLVDPLNQTLEAFKFDTTGYRLLGTWCGSAVVQVEPFAALELDLSALWSR